LNPEGKVYSIVQQKDVLYTKILTQDRILFQLIDK